MSLKAKTRHEVAMNTLNSRAMSVGELDFRLTRAGIRLDNELSVFLHSSPDAAVNARELAKRTKRFVKLLKEYENERWILSRGKAEIVTNRIDTTPRGKK